jgi:hypothetical protein
MMTITDASTAKATLIPTTTPAYLFSPSALGSDAVELTALDPLIAGVDVGACVGVFVALRGIVVVLGAAVGSDALVGRGMEVDELDGWPLG